MEEETEFGIVSSKIIMGIGKTTMSIFNSNDP
jgi:hypothetical protein